MKEKFQAFTNDLLIQTALKSTTLRKNLNTIRTAVTMTMVALSFTLSTAAVFATGGNNGLKTIFDKFTVLFKEVYGLVVAFSTVAAVTIVVIALLTRMLSRNQRSIDAATQWIKNVAITWLLIQGIGYILNIMIDLTAGQDPIDWNEGNPTRP